MDIQKPLEREFPLLAPEIAEKQDSAQRQEAEIPRTMLILEEKSILKNTLIIAAQSSCSAETKIHYQCKAKPQSDTEGKVTQLSRSE